MKKRQQQKGFSLIELMAVILIISIVGFGIFYLAFLRGKRLRVEIAAGDLCSRVEAARSAANNGIEDELARTVDFTKQVLPDTVQLGGSEYDKDLPLAGAPHLTDSKVIFEPQSARAKDMKYGFVVFKSFQEKEERAVFIPYLPGPPLVYIRYSGEKNWSRMTTPLY